MSDKAVAMQRRVSGRTESGESFALFDGEPSSLGGSRHGGFNAYGSQTDVAAVAEAVELATQRLAETSLDSSAGEEAVVAALASAAQDAHKSGNWSAFAKAVRRHAPDATAASLLREGHAFASGGFISGQLHENDKAEVVIVCEPGARVGTRGHTNVVARCFFPARAAQPHAERIQTCTTS